MHWRNRLYLSERMAAQVFSISLADLRTLVATGQLTAAVIADRTVIVTATVIELYGRERRGEEPVNIPIDLLKKKDEIVRSLC